MSHWEIYYARFDARLEKGLAQVRSELRSELHKGLAEVRSELASQRADLIKWMFIFWAGTVVPLAGLAIALIKL